MVSIPVIEEQNKRRTYILQVGVGGMNQWSIFFIKRHAPEAVVLDLACRVEAFPEFVRGLFQ